ncbi:hypothetical protein O1L60_22930 [Streptomyces diastatochromogenes]|nr:hypothetical protein [Streptomyces diastatochromogenes]
MTVRAAWLQSTGQTREDTRIALSALLTPAARAPPAAAALAARHRAGRLRLTGASAMQCTIGTGRAVIQGYDTPRART